MVKFEVEIIQEEGGNFVASSENASGSDVVFAGHGGTPYEALRELVTEFEEAELYRPD